jgi:hypothetical protein
MLNRQAQSFSVFWLLVAAIVALAILTVLLMTIGNVPPLPGSSDPSTLASQTIKELNPQEFGHKLVGPVKFTPNYVLFSRQISSKAGVGFTEKQICLSLGDFEDSDIGFLINDERTKIDYVGRGPVDVKLEVVCSYGAYLADDVDKYFSNVGMKKQWALDCPCVKDKTGYVTKQKCCLIALRGTGVYKELASSGTK